MAKNGRNGTPAYRRIQSVIWKRIETGELKPGDVVELEVSGLGILRNSLGQPEPAHWWPTKRTNPLLPQLSEG